MCEKAKYCNPRIDKCLRGKIEFFNREGVKTFASCCGHGKYPQTIVCYTSTHGFYDVVSGELIPRRKRFYKKDKKGFYFIPETIKD